MVRSAAAELIGTFFLVLTVCSTGLGGAPLAPLAIGAVLAAMVFATGHISGGHLNPAVTVAVFLRGRLAARNVGPYLAAQVAGGLAAAGVARLAYPDDPGAPVKVSGVAFVLELVFTFALAFVVLNVATSADHPHNSFYGLAIGFTVLAGAVAAGGVSGGAFNPAVGIAICLVGLARWSMIWVYLLATLAGGAAAAFAFRALNPRDVAHV